MPGIGRLPEAHARFLAGASGSWGSTALQALGFQPGGLRTRSESSPRRRESRVRSGTPRVAGPPGNAVPCRRPRSASSPRRRESRVRSGTPWAAATARRHRPLPSATQRVVPAQAGIQGQKRHPVGCGAARRRQVRRRRDARRLAWPGGPDAMTGPLLTPDPRPCGSPWIPVHAGITRCAQFPRHRQETPHANRPAPSRGGNTEARARDPSLAKTLRGRPQVAAACKPERLGQGFAARNTAGSSAQRLGLPTGFRQSFLLPARRGGSGTCVKPAMSCGASGSTGSGGGFQRAAAADWSKASSRAATVRCVGAGAVTRRPSASAATEQSSRCHNVGSTSRTTSAATAVRGV